MYYSLAAYNLIAPGDLNLFYSVTIVAFVSDYAIKFYVYLIVNRQFLTEFTRLLKPDRGTSVAMNSSLQS